MATGQLDAAYFAGIVVGSVLALVVPDIGVVSISKNGGGIYFFVKMNIIYTFVIESL